MAAGFRKADRVLRRVKFHCDSGDSGDTVEFSRVGSAIHIDTNEGGWAGDHLYLTMTDARALFNWLGAELHKGDA